MSKIFAKAFLSAIIVCMFCATNLVAQTPRSTPVGDRDVAPDFTLVLDIGLPEIDGYEIARRLRQPTATLRCG